MIQVAVETITPTRAEEMLARNNHNRHLRPSVIGRYARDMVSGSWMVNGEAVKVSEDGVILDGQHRLHAVVQSGVTISTVVISGLPDAAQETIDRGLPRNIPDALRLRGEKDVNNLAAAISQVIVLKSPVPTSTTFWPSTREALDFLGAFPSIRESILIGGRVAKALHSPASTAGAMRFLFTALDEDDGEAFFVALQSGAGLSEASPILRLREVMFREATVPRRMGRSRLQAFYIKAWNAWREGRPMTMLKWSTGGSSPERFPTPV